MNPSFHDTPSSNITDHTRTAPATHLTPTTLDKLTILSAAAKYDVACTSSGVDRGGDGTGIGNTLSCGICHSFAADGRCVSLLKILFTNECIFNCAYCQNNCNCDVPRATFTPEEICTLRHYSQPQLHHGSDLSNSLAPAHCILLPGLHPHKSYPWRRSTPN